MNPTTFPVLEPLLHPERFPTVQPGPGFWSDAIEAAVARVEANLPAFPAGRYPGPASVDLVYPTIGNTDWTSSFWTGQLWLAYELTGRRLFRDAALSHLSDFRSRLDQRTSTDTHDLGFLYTLSAVAAWRLTGDHGARATALKAADLLLLRFHEKAGILQAWGDLNDPDLQGRIIIDCAMNLPLLFWASEQTGNPHYREAAVTHLGRANQYLIRPDASSFHTYYFDTKTGQPLRGATAQGYSDQSCWARGQAWGILGLPLNYGYCPDEAILETSRRLAHYFLNRLPEDFVCHWDLVFTSGTEEKDSSASAIAACGLLELAQRLPVTDTHRPVYERAAIASLASLARSYTTREFPRSNGQLVQAVYNKPKNEGVNECNLWGDYFYLEGLVRVTRPWRPYW